MFQKKMEAAKYSVNTDNPLGIFLTKQGLMYYKITVNQVQRFIETYIDEEELYFTKHPEIVDCSDSQLLENVLGCKVC